MKSAYPLPHKSLSESATRRAFTLIELLTVIAIIGILAAILIPVVGKVRSSANKTKCISNLREIGKQMILFGNDNKYKLPTDSFNSQGGGYTNGESGQTAAGQARITNTKGILAYYLYPYGAKVNDINKLGIADKPTHNSFVCPSINGYGNTALKPEQALSYCLSVSNFNSPGSPFGTTYDVRVFNHTTGGNGAGFVESRYPLPLSKVWAVSDMDLAMAPSAWDNVAAMSPKPVHGTTRNRLYLDGSVRSVDASKCTDMPWEL